MKKNLEIRDGDGGWVRDGARDRSNSRLRETTPLRSTANEVIMPSISP